MRGLNYGFAGRFKSLTRGLAVATPVLMAMAVSAQAATPPSIRISAESQVPACVTPDRLMAFLASRNQRLDDRYRDVARLYKTHGDAWRVRWDYAFFQMILETNYLMFHRGDGRSGDVNPKQYNFAGLGTTGGGVPGDAYPDANTGILAQIQHLVVYSGERVERPIGSRTQKAQDDILSASSAVSKRRAMTFQDLSGRWASDRTYGRNIESIAERYRAMFCTGREPMITASQPASAQPAAAPAPLPAVRPWRASAAEFPPKEGTRVSDRVLDANSQVRVATVKPAVPRTMPPGASQLGASQLGASQLAANNIAAGVASNGESRPRVETTQPSPTQGWTPPVALQLSDPGSTCSLRSASFGGSKAVLIRAVVDGEQQFTALQVLNGFETSMTDSFTRVHAPGGIAIGEFASPEAALQHAQKICATQPSARNAGK